MCAAAVKAVEAATGLKYVESKLPRGSMLLEVASPPPTSLALDPKPASLLPSQDSSSE